MMVVSTCVVCEVLGSWSAGPCMVLDGCDDDVRCLGGWLGEWGVCLGEVRVF